jgi:polyisoprenoid-binding protein YceI
MTISDTTTAVIVPVGTYEIDPAHTRLGFAVRHMVTNVHGHFTRFAGRLEIAGTDLEASGAELTVVPASISTSNADRDTHLRSADFLDVDRYPTMTFRSTRVRRNSDSGFVATGDLTVKDVTRPIDLTLTVTGLATDPYGQLRLGLTGTATLDRRDYGLTWNVALETGGLVVGNRVSLELDASAVAANT